MHVWFRWIFYLNPGAYAFESIMANEFSGLELDCVEPQYVPFGPEYDGVSQANRACTVIGSDSGAIDGEEFVYLQYNYTTGHIWRGFGVIVGFWIFFIAATALAFELRKGGSGSATLLYKRSLRGNRAASAEKESGKIQTSEKSAPPSSQPVKQSIFTWHDLDYYVRHEGQDKQLLNKVFGFVRPGNLVALMGCSGAGKTTYVVLTTFLVTQSSQ